MTDEQNPLRDALAAQLTNIYNYPQEARAALWGADLTGIIDAVESVARSALAEAWDDGSIAYANKWVRVPVNPYRRNAGK